MVSDMVLKGLNSQTRSHSLIELESCSYSCPVITAYELLPNGQIHLKLMPSQCMPAWNCGMCCASICSQGNFRARLENSVFAGWRRTVITCKTSTKANCFDFDFTAVCLNPQSLSRMILQRISGGYNRGNNWPPATRKPSRVQFARTRCIWEDYSPHLTVFKSPVKLLLNNGRTVMSIATQHHEEKPTVGDNSDVALLPAKRTCA